MVQPKVVSLSPNRANIKYSVVIATNIEENFAALAEEVMRRRLSMDRTIIFCRTYDDSSHIYLFLRSRLGSECVEPIGAPDWAQFRLIDMFTGCTHPSVKDMILENFCDPNGPLKIVVATIAFIFVAVAVNAIMFTWVGMRLLASPMAINSFRKVSPLFWHRR